MRIAVSGAHRTGKTTLIDELSRALPNYAIVDEPYHLLEDDGHEFAAVPTLDDFELQLECAIGCLVKSDDNQIFDRCPLDILGYLSAHSACDGFDILRWLARVRAAMQRLDLIIFVPIETPDRLIVTAGDEPTLRRRVDGELRDIVLGDRWAFGVEAFEVRGDVRHRASQVLARVEARRTG